MINISISQIAELINAEVIGNSDLMITGLNGLENSVCGDLTFFYNDKYEKYLYDTKATAIISDNRIKSKNLTDLVLLVVENPYLSYVKVLNFINSQKQRKHSFFHPTAVIGENCDIDRTAYIGANCVIGDNTVIGEYTYLHSNISIYDDCKIGENCLINANVSIYTETIIGNNCVIHSGAVIGADGFGYIEDPVNKSYTKVPQLGNVVIENDVEIGANTTIDRAMVGSTRICNGVKLDNQIQIAHNCEIGEHSAMAAQVGVSGSVKVGKRNRFGGQVGISGHIEIADDVVLMAKSGVAKSIEKGGMYFGAPARERLQAFRIEAVIHQLPELARDIKIIKKEILKENKIDN